MPGLIDTHIHASQYSNTGKHLELPLLKWLEKYTYPTEAGFKDISLARDVYSKAVVRGKLLSVILYFVVVCICY